MSDRHILGVFGQVGQSFLPQFRDALPAWEVVGWTNADPSDIRDKTLQSCTAAVMGPDFILGPGNLPALLAAPKLELLVQSWAGTDWASPALLPNGVTLCNSGGHGAPMSEFVMAAILSHVTEIRELEAELRRGDWSRSGRNPDPTVLHGDLAGKTIGLVGYGEIAQAVAKRAHGFDVRLIAIARSQRPTTPAPLAWIGTSQDLHRLCQESDIIVVTCDLNAETEGLIDAAAFAAMQPHCFLVNVARGEVVAEEALYDALTSRQIAAAAIDTWYRYPTNVINPEPDPDRGGPFRGSRFDFYSLDNIVVTPHCSANSQGADVGRYKIIIETMTDFAAGRPLKRAIMTGTAAR
jgi:phosphoglycerate dehydrogenase-like enzyme